MLRAARIMDEHARVGVVSGCVVDSESGRIDPGCIEMARSPLDREDLPGPQILGFKTEASVVRTRAFYEAGGFWPPLFVGGEEALLALDMAERGWRMVYMEDVITKRAASCQRNAVRRLRWEMRNAIWVAWMRLPANLAWKETLDQLRKAARLRQLQPVLVSVTAGMARVLQRRQVITPRVAAMWGSLYQQAMSAREEQPSHASRRSMV